LNAIENEAKRRNSTRTELNFLEAFNCFPKITTPFTFILADSPIDDFFVGSRTDGRVSDQPAVAFDGVTFVLLDRGAIAAGFV
jgi:hypothetical protein